eukprot:352824-Pyramimonas_sp.AAC.1
MAFASERTPPRLRGWSGTSADIAKAATRLARSSAWFHELHRDAFFGRFDIQGLFKTKLNR